MVPGFYKNADRAIPCISVIKNKLLKTQKQENLIMW